jgi:hypothetical protein
MFKKFKKNLDKSIEKIHLFLATFFSLVAASAGLIYLHKELTIIPAAIFTVLTGLYLIYATIYKVNKYIRNIFRAKNIYALFLGYFFVVILILIPITLAHTIIETNQMGSIEHCADSSKGIIHKDYISNYDLAFENFYMIQNDACYLGYSKLLKYITYMIGSFVNLGLLAIAMNQFRPK